MNDIIVGNEYTAKNQGTAITPDTISVTVVWVDDEDVHYKKKGSQKIYQTSVTRFLEIIRSS